MKKFLPALLVTCILLFIAFKCDTKSSDKPATFSFKSREEFLEQMLYLKSVHEFNSASTLQRCVDMWGLPDQHEFSNVFDGEQVGQTLVCSWNKVTVDGQHIELTFSVDSVDPTLITNKDGSLDKERLHYLHLVQYSMR